MVIFSTENYKYMKKSIYMVLLMIFYISLIVQSCSKAELENDSITEDGYSIHIEMYVCSEHDSRKSPDVGSTVYIYRDFYSIDIISYKLLHNGNLIDNNGNIIEPFITGKISESGEFLVKEIELTEKNTVITVSNEDPNVVTARSFTNSEKNIHLIFNFYNAYSSVSGSE